MVEEKFKIVIFGAFGAGKSTLIQTLDPQAKHIEADCPVKGSTTIALDYGRVQLGERRVYLYGTPGQERFEFARKIIGTGMDGAVLLVDATAEVDEFICAMFSSLVGSGIPFVVMLNKTDHPDGTKTKGLQQQFGAVPVWLVSAKDRRQAQIALTTFIDTLPPHVSREKKN
ncbi:MAG: ATP/GTP-binding protein [Methanoregula sp.]|jgi:hypothetical protein